MPEGLPPELRRRVVVARKGEAPLAQLANDLGIFGSCVRRWLKIFDVDNDPSRHEEQRVAELRELRKRSKVLEQEDEILRRAAPLFAREIAPR
jgi:transposase